MSVNMVSKLMVSLEKRRASFGDEVNCSSSLHENNPTTAHARTHTQTTDL